MRAFERVFGVEGRVAFFRARGLKPVHFQVLVNEADKAIGSLVRCDRDGESVTVRCVGDAESATMRVLGGAS